VGRGIAIGVAMGLYAFLVASLAICLVPVYLLRRRDYPRAQDHVVCGEPTPTDVVKNASVAYALPMAAFVPLFAAGARGDFWPAIIGGCAFGLGVFLLYRLKRPILEFLDDAVRRDESVTVQAFIARRCGNDPRVRLAAAALSIAALAGLLIGEAFAAASLLVPIPANRGATLLMTAALVGLSLLYALPAGQSGVMRSAQAQLGIAYLGLFGSAALALYIAMSDLNEVPAQGTFAIALFAVCCALVLYYRRSKYVDTSPITMSGVGPADAALGREALGSRLFRRFAKILNVCISVMVASGLAFALMLIYAEDAPAVLRAGAVALQTEPRVSATELAALVLLPLLYPLVDITNWQRLAAVAQMEGEPAAATRQATVLRKILGIYGFETALIWLVMCLLGAIAGASMQATDAANGLQDFVQQLADEDNIVTSGALALLVAAVLAIALSTMTGVFSAIVCAFRYDIAPALSVRPGSGPPPAIQEALARRNAITAAGVVALAMLAVFCAFHALRPMNLGGTEFLTLVFAVFCAQLSFVPLLVGATIGRLKDGAVGPGWALAVLACGTVAGVACGAIHLAGGSEAWPWAAAPASLGGSVLVFIVAGIARRPG
jgi:hypothetical protein